MELDEMQTLTENAWDQFRARYHANLQHTTNGEDGWTDLDGAGILRVRSDAPKIATFILSVTDSLNGNGELPDTSLLLSSAVNAGLDLEDFTCTVLSLMFLMDGIYSTRSGKKDTVVQVLKGFINGVGQQSTAESTPLKTRTQTEPTPSPAPADALPRGKKAKRGRTKPSPPKKKKRSKLTRGKHGKSATTKPTTKNRRKSRRN